MTVNPHLLKNALAPIGETSIGVHGKKYLVVSKGLKKAIPDPPLVNASKIPWLAARRMRLTPLSRPQNWKNKVDAHCLDQPTSDPQHKLCQTYDMFWSQRDFWEIRYLSPG
jgi:hypothetical protein